MRSSDSSSGHSSAPSTCHVWGSKRRAERAGRSAACFEWRTRMQPVTRPLGVHRACTLRMCLKGTLEFD
eukprot:6739015-Prymnesium_polylepis.1